MAIGNFLQVDAIDRFAYSGDKETPAKLDAIDPADFLHVHLSGDVPTKTLVYYLVELKPKDPSLVRGVARTLKSVAGQSAYDVVVQHYSMKAATRYLLILQAGPGAAPWAVASVELKTK